VRLGVADLDLDDVSRFLERDRPGGNAIGNPARTAASQFGGLISEGHPTVAGLVLFGRIPQEHLPFAQINAARNPGNGHIQWPSDRKDLTGRLLDVLDQAMRFLYLHRRDPSQDCAGWSQSLEPELPDGALREALVNASAHRDYTVQGPVRLFVFDDRVEFSHTRKGSKTRLMWSDAHGPPCSSNPHISCAAPTRDWSRVAGSGIPRIVRP